MNRSLVLFAICIAVNGVNGRPQATLPFVNTPFTPTIIAIRPQPVYLSPSGQMIYLAGGLPMNFNVPRPLMPMPMSMLLPIRGSPKGYFFPLPFFPYFNNLNPGLYKKSADGTSFILSESENKTTHSLTAATESPTVSTQSTVNLPSLNSTIGSLPVAEIDVAQQVTQQFTANSTSSVPLTSPTFSIHSTRSSNGDYNFDYSVNNIETGDVKSQGEKRLNGVVTGYYTMLETDGTLRKVNYTADAENGFRATVNKQPVLINAKINN